MKYNSLMSAKDAVIKVLIKYPEARKDDDFLIIKTYKELGYDIESFDFVRFTMRKDKPSFKTIYRARRVLKANPKYSDLFNDDTENKRINCIDIVQEFNRNNR